MSFIPPLRHFWRVILAVVLVGGLLHVPRVGAQGETGVSDERFARLARGINLPFWFWYPPDDVDARFSDDDFALIRDLGFTFVRVPVDLGFVMDQDSPDLLNAGSVAAVDRGLDRLLAHDLAVIVDLHSTSLADSDASNFSAALEDDAFVEVFIQFWRAFAAHLSARDPEMIFFEPMNEPVFYDDPGRWPPIQERLVGAIRESAPDHTIIATGARWSSLETLTQLRPLADPNIVYNFHFYEPFPFTHQGAEWASPEWAPLRGVPYPSSPEAVQPVIDTLADPAIQQIVRDYGNERWNAARLENLIAQAARWGRRYGVRLLCGEFGVYAPYAPPADRAQWLRDTRTIFEKYQIGWAMWEYDEDFGLVTHPNGAPVVDSAIADALGLNMAATG